MANKPLEQWQKEDAARLRELWNAYRERTGESQVDVAPQFDFSQAAFSQYIQGRIPLNLNALFDFAHLFRCRLSDISPKLAEKVYRWVDDAERHSFLAIEEFLNTNDLRLLSTTDLRAIEAMIMHLISAKKENPTPGKQRFRPRLVKP